MKLYSSPNSCALSPNIVLRELGLPFTLEQVDLGKKLLKKDNSSYWEVNAKGYVPAVELDDGTVLTEGAIIVQVLADKHPERKLAPAWGTMERIRMQEWLHFVATELHKAASPLYNAKANDEYKAILGDRLRQRLGVLEKHMEGKNFIMGEQFTVADAYAFYALKALQRLLKTDLAELPNLKTYFARVGSRPAVVAALASEA